MAALFLSTSPILALTDDDNTLSGSVTVNASADYAEAKISWGHYATAPAISSVTLGGNAMTAVAANTGGAIGGVADARNQTFRLISPPTGSQTLLVTFASQTYAQSGDVESYSGVDQTTPTEGSNSATGTSASPLVAPTTTTASGNLISGSALTGNTSAANISCDYTETSEVDFTSVANVVSAYGYRATTGSGQNIEWSQSSVLWYAQCHVIRAAASATNYTLTADAGSYSLAGQDATLDYVGNSPTAYTLACETGSYNVVGQTATFAFSGSSSGGGGAVYWHSWWFKPEWKDGIRKKKLSPKAKKIIQDVIRDVPEVVNQVGISQSQEISLRARLLAEQIGFNELYLRALQDELLNQNLTETQQPIIVDTAQEEKEAISMLMMMLM